MAFPAPAAVPARVLAWLVSAQGLGELHPALAPTPVWRAPTLADSTPEQAAELLTVLGWRDRRGWLEREVAASLAALCRPVDERYGLISHDGVMIRVLTARIGRDAVLAVRTPDEVVGLSTIPAGRLTDRIVAQTPQVPAAKGNALSVSPDEVRSTDRHGRQRTATGLLRKASSHARQAKQLLSRPRTGGGELWAAVRDRAGTRRVIARPISYADLDCGRYLLTASGESVVRLDPVNRAELVTALNTARRSLHRGDSTQRRG